MGTRNAAELPDGILVINETAQLAPGAAVADDGTVTVHVMRPCLGKGRGRHVYEADMLRRHAESGHFNDWPMFVDHESPEARRKAGGLPRSFRDLGGRIQETWWDDKAPAADGFGQGAVAAKVLPVPWIQELLRHDPKLGKVSLNTHATGVMPTSRGGRPAYIVEGFDNEGSLDWVTREGAGGKVVQLLEAAYDEGRDEEAVTRILEALPDDHLRDLIRNERPAVAEALRTADRGDLEEDEDVDKQQIQEAAVEALRSDEGREALNEVVQETVQEAVKETIREVLPNAIGKAAGVIEEGAKAAASAEVRKGRLREKGAKAVQEADLPEKFAQDATEAIHRAADEAEDKTEEKDGETVVTESAEQQFDAIVESTIKHATELVESVRPRSATPTRRRTVVAENGGASGEDDERAVREAEADEREYALHELQEAGVDVKAAYGIGKDEEKDKDAADKPKPDEEPAAATA